MVAEILEMAGNMAKDNKKKRIIPRHLLLTIKNDDEMSKLLSHVTIAQGGVVPKLNPVLANKPTAKQSKKGVKKKDDKEPTIEDENEE